MNIVQRAILFLIVGNLLAVQVGLAAVFNHPGAYRHPETGIAFPASMAALEKIEQQGAFEYDKASPGQDVSVGYSSPEVTATVYIFTRGLKCVPSDLGSPTMKLHFRDACNGVFQAEAYSNVKMISEDIVPWGGKTGIKALHAAISLVKDGGDCLSHVYLAGFRNHFIKVRYTYKAAEKRSAEKVEKVFLGELALLLEVAAGAPPKLAIAALNGDAELVSELLKEGADVNAVHPIVGTALMAAAKNGHLDVVRLLIDNGADLNAVAEDSYTALMVAASAGDLDVVQLLVDKGAALNASEGNGVTPLMLAADNGHLEAAKLLADKGADVNAETAEGYPVLWNALFNIHLDIAQCLVENGADINAKSNDGRVAITIAAENGAWEVVKWLAEHGADLDEKLSGGQTLLTQVRQLRGQKFGFPRKLEGQA